MNSFKSSSKSLFHSAKASPNLFIFTLEIASSISCCDNCSSLDWGACVPSVPLVVVPNRFVDPTFVPVVLPKEFNPVVVPKIFELPVEPNVLVLVVVPLFVLDVPNKPPAAVVVVEPVVVPMDNALVVPNAEVFEFVVFPPKRFVPWVVFVCVDAVVLLPKRLVVVPWVVFVDEPVLVVVLLKRFVVVPVEVLCWAAGVVAALLPNKFVDVPVVVPVAGVAVVAAVGLLPNNPVVVPCVVLFCAIGLPNKPVVAPVAVLG